MTFWTKDSAWAVHFGIVLLTFALAAPLVAQAGESSAPREVSPQAKAAVQQFMKSESVFIQNSGQWKDEDIRFALNSMGANVGLTDTGPRFQLFRPSEEPASRSSQPGRSSLPGRTLDNEINPSPDEKPAPAEMREFRAIFQGATKSQPEGRDKTDQTFNYLVGEVKNQRQNVPSFESVWYKGLYPGIDLELKGRRSGLKYNFHVAPGVDWQAIQIRYDGIEKLSLKDDGSLQIDLAKGWSPLSDGAPYIYQEVDGQKVQVSGRYRLINEQTYGFEVTGDYDKTKPLVIDPEVVWGSYLGGTSDDGGYGIAVDVSGNVYATGYTWSSGWVSGGWDVSSDSRDGFVAKLNSAGAHQWSTYLGGTSDDYGQGIAVDGGGNVYATGSTSSSGWVSGGGDTSYGGGGYWDSFVVKLNSAGAHQWSTYLGGTSTDSGYGIAVDGSGNVYSIGTTSSAGWVSGGWDTSNGGTDGYVVKLNSAGAHEWSTYLGGTGEDKGNGIAVDGSGNVYATGSTWSSGWVSGGWDTSYAGGYDGFVVKLNSAGTHLWSTYLGELGYDVGFGIAVGGSGNIYATGWTRSSDWVNGGWDTSLGGNYDGYVVKLNSAGAHQWSSYLGGPNDDEGFGIEVDGKGDVYATGFTASGGWVSGGWDTSQNGSYDGYVVKLNSAGAHLWSSYVGGAGYDTGNGIAVGDSGNIYATGCTNSIGWAGGGWDDSHNGGTDGFVVKIGNSHTLTYTAGPVGSLSGITVQSVLDGSDGTAVTAVPNANYHFVKWSDGSTDNPRTDSNVTANISVTAEFAIDTYALDYAAGAGGSITGEGHQVVDHGSDGAAVTAAPATGYHFVKWSDDSTDNPRTDTNVTADISVAAEFAVNTYTLDYAAGSNGSISGDAHQIIDYGLDGTSVTAVPNPGYHFVQWNDGVLTAARQDLNVTENINVIASFSNTYTLTYTAGANGTISGTSSQTINHGNSGSEVEAIPDPGYAFSQWSDGLLTASRTETNVTANLSVTAIFVLLPPAAPSDPGADSITTTSIRWIWNDNSLFETGFNVWSDPGTGAPITLRITTAANTANWTQNGLTPNTQHSFQVAATNAAGDSARTATYSAWTLAALPLSPTVNNPGGHSLDVVIAAGDTNPSNTEYAICCTTASQWVQSDGSLGIAPVWATAATWATKTVTGLADETTFNFRIRARNGYGIETADSPTGSGTTLDITLPTAPAVSGSTPTINTTPTWSWTAGGGGNGTFRYQLDSEAGGWTETAELSWTPASALAAGAHTLYVQERDEVGNWSASGSFAITIQATGSIQITILPASAVTTGGKWRRVGTSTWLDSGAIEGPLAVGQYEIEFSVVPTLRKPDNIIISVTAGQTVPGSGTYGQTAVEGSGWKVYR